MRGRTDVDVAVVGGGLAGLAAAGRLLEGGRSPVLFEATDRVGGRQRTTRLGGHVLEEGAVFFGSNYPTLSAKLRETGLDAHLKVYDSRSIVNFPVGRQTGSDPAALLRTPNLPVAEKLALVPFAVTALPLAAEIRASLGTRVKSPGARRLDRIAASDWLTARVGPRFVDEVASPFMEALGFAPARDWSALGAMQILAFGGMAQLFGIREGNATFATRLADPLDVRLGTRVVRIAPDPAGIEIEVDAGGSTESVRARHLVLAVPAPVAAELVSGALRQTLRRFHFSSSIVAAVAIESLDIGMPAVSVFGGEGHGRIRGIVAEQAGPGEPVVSYAALAHPWQYEYFEAADSEVVRVLTDYLEIVNDKPVDVIESRVIRWEHSIPIPGPGSIPLREEAFRLATRVPHLDIAGDWTISPSQEGALVSGIEAADRVVGI
ncbi:MAG: FAD-dependent oxidoreductase [Acidimicrobiia bacterium]|nr:FAD-dependent oxidoreductase [Acidimicrobiia bacterium]